MIRCSGVVLIVFLGSGCVLEQDSKSSPDESLSYSDYCYLESNRDVFLTRSDAALIAETSSCMECRSLSGRSFCNDNFGSWWIEIETNQTDKKAFCVIDAETRKAIVYWSE